MCIIIIIMDYFLLFLFFCSAAVACVGAFYEKMGRMLGSSFPDTINNLLKALKSAEVRVTFEDSSTSSYF